MIGSLFPPVHGKDAPCMKRGKRNGLEKASLSYRAVMRSMCFCVLMPPVLDAVIVRE